MRAFKGEGERCLGNLSFSPGIPKQRFVKTLQIAWTALALVKTGKDLIRDWWKDAVSPLGEGTRKLEHGPKQDSPGGDDHRLPTHRWPGPGGEDILTPDVSCQADPTCRSRPSLHPLLKHSLGLPGRSCSSRGRLLLKHPALDQGKVHAGDSGGQQCPLLPAPRSSPCGRWILSSVSTLHDLDCRVMSLNSKAELWESRNESWIFNFCCHMLKSMRWYGVIVTLPRWL